MEELDIERFLAVPDETKRDILSFITDPKEITRLGNESSYLKNLLYSAVTQLHSDDDPCYLTTDWLNNYPFLNYVSDNIIFTINVDQQQNFKIPYNLRTMTLCILYDSYDQELIEEIIYNILKHLMVINQYYQIPGLNQYTIRIIVNDANKYHSSQALVIDRGYITQFNNIKNLFEIRIRRTPIDWNSILDRLGLKVVQEESERDNGETSLIQYYMNYPDEENYHEYYYNNIFIDTSCYPGTQFKNFISDISSEMNINLFEILKGYTLTGYFRTDFFPLTHLVDYYLKVMLGEYGNNWTIEKLSKLKIAKYFDINKIEAVNGLVIGPILSDILLSKNEDKNKLIAHLYLTIPSISELIDEDNKKIRVLHNYQRDR